MTRYNFAVYAAECMYPATTPAGRSVASTISRLQQSGFDTVLLRQFHIGRNSSRTPHMKTGDIYFNKTLIISGGSYVGDEGWPELICQMSGGTVIQVGASIGGGGVMDFQTIQTIYASNNNSFAGTNLEQNFKTLRAVLHSIGMIDMHCQETFDRESFVAFCRMLIGIGFEISFCPNTDQSFWIDSLAAINKSIHGAVKRWHLHRYDGGDGHDIEYWVRALKKAIPGYNTDNYILVGDRSDDAPSKVRIRMGGYKNESWVGGGFITTLDEIIKRNPQDPLMEMVSYVNAICVGLGEFIRSELPLVISPLALHPNPDLTADDRDLIRQQIKYQNSTRSKFDDQQNAGENSKIIPLSNVSFKSNFFSIIKVEFPIKKGISLVIDLSVDSGNTSLVIPYGDDCEKWDNYKVIGKGTEPWGCPAYIVTGSIIFKCVDGTDFTIEDCVFFACYDDNDQGTRTANFGIGRIVPWNANEKNTTDGITLQSPLSYQTSYPFVEVDLAPDYKRVDETPKSSLILYDVIPQGFTMLNTMPNRPWMSVTPQSLTFGNQVTSWPPAADGNETWTALIDTGGTFFSVDDPTGTLGPTLPKAIPFTPPDGSTDCYRTTADMQLALVGWNDIGYYTYKISMRVMPENMVPYTALVCKSRPAIQCEFCLNVGTVSFFTNRLLIDYTSNSIGLAPKIPNETQTIALVTYDLSGNKYYLLGNIGNGEISLAPGTGQGYSGTYWISKILPDKTLCFKYMGHHGNEQIGFLDGKTQDGGVAIAPNHDDEKGYSGTHWEQQKQYDGSFTLKCMGKKANSSHQYLQAITNDNTVKLTDEAGPTIPGTCWHAVTIPPSIVLSCQSPSNDNSCRFLDGVTGNGQVQLAPYTNSTRYSGTYWRLEPLIDGTFALLCLGTRRNDNALYLYCDGSGGPVSLAPDTSSPGTHWYMEAAATQGQEYNVILYCLRPYGTTSEAPFNLYGDASKCQVWAQPALSGPPSPGINWNIITCNLGAKYE